MAGSRPAIKVKNGGVDGMFTVKDVRGDGNYSFNAVVLSSDINIQCPLDLKDDMAAKLQDNNEAKVIYNEIFSNEEPYETFVDGIGRREKYQDTKAVVFIGMLYGVNMCFVTKWVKGFSDS